MNNDYLKAISNKVEGKEIMPELQQIPLDRVLTPTENNTRTSLGDLKDLTASIKEVGVKEPILVKNLENDRNEVEVFAGFRRVGASKLAEKKTIPAIVYPRKSVTKKLALVLNITENVQREDLNPIDEAQAFMKLRTEHKLSDDDICSGIGVRKSRLYQRLRLLELPINIKNALKEDKISMVAALEIGKLPEGKQSKYIKLANELRGEHLRKMIEKELERIRQKTGTAEKPPEKDSKEKEDSAAYTELSRSNRKHADVLAKHFKLDAKEIDEIKSVNWRAMELEDLKVVTRLFDTLVDIVPNQLEFNEKAEQEIVAAVEQGKGLDLEASVVRQALIQSIKHRAEEQTLESAPKGKRPKVSYAITKSVLDEFFSPE